MNRVSVKDRLLSGTIPVLMKSNLKPDADNPVLVSRLINI